MRAREAVERARFRLLASIRPRITVTPPPEGIHVDRDVEVAVADGTILRVDVFRPEQPGRYPVLMCAHPYRKGNTPKADGKGGYKVSNQVRLIPQSQPYTISAWTSWEAPDPAFWVPHGYVVVNGGERLTPR